MGKNERRANLEAVRDRYQKASKKAKAIILDEFCQVCGYNQMRSKKVVAAIPLWLPFYEEAYEKLSDEIRDNLLSVSAATIDRLLAPTRARTRLRGRCVTKPLTLSN